MEDFTPRNLAKHLVRAAIAMQASQMTRDAMVDYTRFEADDKIVKLTAGAVAWGVSAKLKPYTDKAVDKTADFVNAKREARKAKKEDTTEKE